MQSSCAQLAEKWVIRLGVPPPPPDFEGVGKSSFFLGGGGTIADPFF
jgi:hypothetical protein